MHTTIKSQPTTDIACNRLSNLLHVFSHVCPKSFLSNVTYTIVLVFHGPSPQISHGCDLSCHKVHGRTEGREGGMEGKWEGRLTNTVGCASARHSSKSLISAGLYMSNLVRSAEDDGCRPGKETVAPELQAAHPPID